MTVQPGALYPLGAREEGAQRLRGPRDTRAPQAGRTGVSSGRMAPSEETS